MTGIPEAALGNHLALLGKTGSGKSSTGKLAVEQVVADGFRVCILDTVKSDWWGITSSADGKSPGLPFKILGGPRGHVPLHSSAGAAIGQLVGTGKLPLSIIDMADFEPGGLQRFFVDFSQALMRHARGVLYLVIEEAHEVAPKERAGIGAESMALHWAKKLATAGRSKGIRLIVATQRLQALHNAVLGSCETIITHRLTIPADQAPVINWLKANTDKATTERVANSLSSLPTGTGWLCSGEARLFEKVAFPKFKTYDNAATPVSDDEEIDVAMAPVDHDELAAIIGDAVKEAEANDPKRLKAEIARLTRELGAQPPAAASDKSIEAAERRGYDRGHDDGSAQVLKALGGIATDLAASVGHAKEACERSERLLGSFGTFVDAMATEPRAKSASPSSEGANTPAPRPAQAPKSPASVPPDGAIPSGCAKPLAALAAVYPSGLTEAQWSTAAGYKRSGGTWGTYKSRLKGAGLIEQREGRWFATASGAEAAGEVELPPPAGPGLVRWWAAKLPGTGKMAEALIDAWPEHIHREDLARRLAMSAGGGSFGTYLSRLSGPGLIERIGSTVRLSKEAMGPR